MRIFDKWFGKKSLKAPDNFLLYENSDSGIRIKYPPYWKIDEGAGRIIAHFYPPEENKLDVFQDDVLMAYTDLPPVPITQREFMNDSIEFRVKEFEYENSKLINKGAITLAGNLGYRMVYTKKAPFSNTNLKCMEVWTVKYNRLYTIIYTAKANTYSDFLENIEQIINSFELLK